MTESVTVLTADFVTEQSSEFDQHDHIYRRNFKFFLADFVIFSIGINLIGATTVIPSFVSKLTDSQVLLALSSQMFEIGWLLPQLLVARRLMRVERKKWWFVGPSIPARTLMLIFAGVIILLGPERRGVMLALFLLFYGLLALSDGLVGAPWIDLSRNSLNDERRTRLFGWGNLLVGLSVLGIVPLVNFILGDSGLDYPNNYALLFGLSGVMFFITTPLIAFVHELPGSKAQDTVPPLREYLSSLLRVLREDVPFRIVVSSRLLASLSMLAAPFYIGLATEQLGMPEADAVSHFLLMTTTGSVMGAALFSWFGPRRSILFIRLLVGVGVMQPLLALLAGKIGLAPLYVAFFVAGMAGTNLGISFMNWVIMYATPEQCPIYSSLFNTITMVGVFAAPFIGGKLVETWGYTAAFIVAFGLMLGALSVMLHYAGLLDKNRAVS